MIKEEQEREKWEVIEELKNLIKFHVEYSKIIITPNALREINFLKEAPTEDAPANWRLK